MSNARWATKEEVAKRLDAVDLKAGVKKAGIPMGFDDNYLYVDTKKRWITLCDPIGTSYLAFNTNLLHPKFY